jgi:hypothetical protein
MSVCTQATCPHGRGVFAYLADGPWRGDQADPNWGRYPWVHDTTAEDARGALEVCDLMPFALPVDVGEMCACGHSSDMHKTGPGPIPAGMLANPRPCWCECGDFRHRREDLERWRAEAGRRRGAARPVAVAEPASPGEARPGEPVQLALFGDVTRAPARAAQRRPVKQLTVTGGLL